MISCINFNENLKWSSCSFFEGMGHIKLSWMVNNHANAVRSNLGPQVGQALNLGAGEWDAIQHLLWKLSTGIPAVER